MKLSLLALLAAAVFPAAVMARPAFTASSSAAATYAAELIARPVRYDGHKLIRLFGLTEEQNQMLIDRYDVWGNSNPQTADVRVTPEQYQEIKALGIEFSILDDNVQDEIDEETSRLREAAAVKAFSAKSVSALDATWFEEYHRYDDIKAWFKSLADEYSSAGLKVEFVPSIGQSHENRDLFAVHISSTKSVPGRDVKDKIFLSALNHAREWIAGSTIQFIASQLVQQYGQDDEVTSLLDKLEFVLVPVINPDGYEYSWTKERLWRKNRSRNAGGSFGTDPNRNYDDNHWGEGGSSTNPTSETYRGVAAASEPEVQAVQSYYYKNPTIIGAIDIHSFSQLILRPWGWTKKDSPDEALSKKLGDKMRDIIKSVHGKAYTSQKSIDLYTTTGTASDFYYSDNAVTRLGHRAYGFTLELRPTSSAGQSGFILPPKEIIPTGEEIFPSVLYFAKFADENKLK